jgi:hypothetical protein
MEMQMVKNLFSEPFILEESLPIVLDFHRSHAFSLEIKRKGRFLDA